MVVFAGGGGAKRAGVERANVRSLLPKVCRRRGQLGSTSATDVNKLHADHETIEQRPPGRWLCRRTWRRPRLSGGQRLIASR